MKGSIYPWNTEVVVNYLNLNPPIPLPFKSIYTGDKSRYVFLITHDSTNYILKGFQFKIPPRNSRVDEYKNALSEFLREIAEIFAEYYITKTASVFCSHFCKFFNIDYKFDLSDNDSDSSLFILEILQEYGGESLAMQIMSKKYTIKEVFNLMYQSASAIAFLHHTGIAHMDLKPDNIVYNKLTDCVKIIDFGISMNYTQSISLREVMTDSIKGLTYEFAAPEAIKKLNNNESKLILASVDVYCWGMTFCHLLLNKESPKMEVEAQKLNKKITENNEQYNKEAKDELMKVTAASTEDQEILKWIQDTILHSLEFLPENRPKFKDILLSIDKQLRSKSKYTEKIDKEQQELIEKIAGRYHKLQELEEKVNENIKLAEVYKLKAQHAEIEIQKQLDEKKLLMNEVQRLQDILLKYSEEQKKKHNTTTSTRVIDIFAVFKPSPKPIITCEGLPVVASIINEEKPEIIAGKR